MPWPLPAPGDISNRAAGVYEAEYQRVYQLLNPGMPPVVVDARSPISTLAVQGRVIEISCWDLYLYQSRLASELLPDTAIDWLPRHGSIWGVPQDQATPALGNVLAASTLGCTVPAQAALTAPSGAQYVVTQATQLPAGGAATAVPVQASVAGSAGNLPAGTVLTFVNAVRGLTSLLPGSVSQSVAVDPNGLSDGQDLEDPEDWRARILERIRERNGGGTGTDYIEWVGEVLQNAIVLPTQLQLGVVNVYLAVKQAPDANGLAQPPRPPTVSELNVVSAYLNDAMNRKPLGMEVLVTAAVLVPVPVSIALKPDTVAVAAAATTALQLYFASLTIQSTVDVSVLDAAISAGDGETSHDRLAPAADLKFTGAQLPVLGPVTFTQAAQ